MTEKEPLTKLQANALSPVVLAFVGDAVYSLYVRERLVRTGGGKASQYQKSASKIVSAKGQSEFLDKLMQLFTEEEQDVFRRAKNAKKATKSKSASNLEYSRSTGFEAVLGYLHLTGQAARILEILSNCDESMFQVSKEVQVFKPSFK